jgi:hypothetical protein
MSDAIVTPASEFHMAIMMEVLMDGREFIPKTQRWHDLLWYLVHTKYYENLSVVSLKQTEV